MTQATASPKFYQLESNALSRNAYAICAPFRTAEGRLMADSFVVGRLNSGQPFSRGCRVTFPAPGTDTGPIQVNDEFAYAEALRQAENDVRALVEETKSISVAPNAWLQLGFVEIASSRLAAVWIEGVLNAKLTRIGQVTGSPALASFIDSLKSLPTITRDGIPLG